MTTTNAKSGARKHRPHGAIVTGAPIAPSVSHAPSVSISRFGRGRRPRPACPDPRHRARSFATRAVAGRLGTAVASTIRVAHLAMAAEAMWKSATEGGGVTLGWKTSPGGPYERGRSAADGLVGNTDVGDLRGHADHEREIHKVPVVGMVVLVAARKLQAAGFGAAVIIVGVMQREYGVHSRPGQRDRHGRQR